ncbi:MAG: O-antigen ligase family protein [Gammaproteobacteria bacterium]|nr:O-antigen ligase family protein [Gammaproteobacteria bacterium]
MISILPSMSPIFLILALFALPISSTARSLFIILAVLCFIFNSSARDDLKSLLAKPWMLALLALLSVAILGCFWGPATAHEKWIVLEKYSKLLCLPFFVVGFRNARTRHAAMHAFLAAMLLTTALLILKAMGMVDYGGPDPGQLFRNHTMTGYMLAFAAYLTLTFAFKTTGLKRIAYAVCFVVLSYTVIFICTGRMAYLSYAVVMLVWFFQYFSWRKAMLFGGGFLLCFCVSYQVNPTMQFLLHQAEDDWALYHQDVKNTSLGLRLQFHTYAYRLFKQHIWIGNGTGGFSHLLKRDASEVIRYGATSDRAKPFIAWEPHSQYWLIASEYGLMGLSLYFFFLGSLLWESLRLREMRAMACATLLTFIMWSLTDSLMLYSGTGYFFFLFLALCFSASKSPSNLCSLADEAGAQAHLLSPAKAGETQT